MKKLCGIGMTLVLIFAFTLPTFADDGWMGTGVAPTPTPTPPAPVVSAASAAPTTPDPTPQDGDLLGQAYIITLAIIKNILSIP